MSKHTPGSWSTLDCRKFLWDGRREEIHILGPEGESGGCPVLAVVRVSRERPVPEAIAEANARLIVAAPEYHTFTELFLRVFGGPGANPFMKARREVSAEEMNLLVRLAEKAHSKAESG